MADGLEIDGNILPHARNLVKALEAEDVEKAQMCLGSLTKIYETDMFKEMGKLTRELHEALNGFQVDNHIIEIAETDIPDAKERLNYVIEMTEKAAHKTLNAVEQSIPICEMIENQTRDIGKKWKRFISRDTTADEFRALSREIDAFMEKSPEDSALLKENLNNVLIAQDFQDLTGQVIRRVIKLVHDIEESLVGFIKISSHIVESEIAEEKNERKLDGPQLPGKEKSDALTSQDDVDDLLSSLGF